MTHKIQIKYSPYNHRRYGKPWIAKVKSWAGQNPELDWGFWFGNADYGGYTQVDAEVGDLIRNGQKDLRSSKTENEWNVVEEGGFLKEITPSEARTIWEARAVCVQ